MLVSKYFKLLLETVIKSSVSLLGANYYKCEICSQDFRLQGELKLHIPTHFTQNSDAVGPTNAGQIS